VSDALYIPDGDRFVSTELTRGPWDPSAQHGGPPSALIARAIERLAPDDLALVRLTVEIMRPVPIVPLTVATDVIRAGRRVQVVDAALRDGDDIVCRARGIRMRVAEVPLPDTVRPDPAPTPPSDSMESSVPFDSGSVALNTHGVDLREASGTLLAAGPAAVWIRLRQPLVAGEELSGAQRAVCAADFGNGMSWALPFDRYVFVNTDLTVHLHRQPVGEWICVDARTVASPTGVGLTTTMLSDTSASVGSATQTLFVDQRGGAA